MDAAPLTDPKKIRQLTEAKIEAERQQFAPEPESKHGSNGQDREERDPIPSKVVLARLRANEDGDAWLFVELHRGRFLFDHAAGVWYKWTGHYWADDFINEVMAGIEEVISIYGLAVQQEAWLRLQAEKSGNQAKSKIHERNEADLLKRVRALQALNRKKNVLELAKIGTKGLGITGEEWDADGWHLGCKNGVIDLKTGAFRPGKPENFIKTIAPVEFKDIEEPAPNWELFLSEVFDGQAELLDFLRRLLGYCITGQTTEHIFPIFWGSGRNGKSTLLETLGFVLGPLTGTLQAETILRQTYTKNAGGPSPDIMALRGKRLIWFSESNEGRRLDAGKLKLLTGGDTLTGRNPYGRRQINFRPIHKIILSTNNRPHADPQDFALFSRILLISFNLAFVSDPDPTKANEKKADKNLLERLKIEAPGILAYLVRGCIEWQREGLNPPEAVKEAVKAYQEDEDTLQDFIEDRCKTGDGYEVKSGELYKDYQKWNEETGLRAMNGKRFGQEMKRRFDSRKSNYVSYQGIDLLDH